MAKEKNTFQYTNQPVPIKLSRYNQFGLPHVLPRNHQFNWKQRKKHFKQNQSLSYLHSMKDMSYQRKNKRKKNDTCLNNSVNVFHTDSHSKWNLGTLLRKLNTIAELQWFWMFYMLPPERINKQQKDPQAKENHTIMHLELAISIFSIESVDLM